MTPAEGRLLMVLIRNPLPEIRRAGDHAYDHRQSRSENPYPPETPEWLNWDAGWNDAMARNS